LRSRDDVSRLVETDASAILIPAGTDLVTIDSQTVES
jgi:hypothetical protein